MKNNFMISIGVKNLKESITFYKDTLGFTLLSQIEIDENTSMAFLLFNDAIEVQLIQRKDEEWNNDSKVTLSFKTDDIENDLNRLKIDDCSHQIVALPTGVSVLPFVDPNGVKLSFISEGTQ